MSNDIRNLLAETVAALNVIGHTPADVIYVGTSPAANGPHYTCTWAEFERLADFEYDGGFGAAAIAMDLVVICAGGDSLSRGEYDGSEWWNVHVVSRIPADTLPIRTLGGRDVMWETLGELNGDE